MTVNDYLARRDARPGGGAMWTYLTTDRPFGNYTERILKALVAKLRK